MQGTPCAARKCTWRWWYDIANYRTVYQHGDNEEAKLFIDDVVRVQTDYVAYTVLREWSERLHAWEDEGIQTDASNDENFDRLVRKFERA